MCVCGCFGCICVCEGDRDSVGVGQQKRLDKRNKKILLSCKQRLFEGLCEMYVELVHETTDYNFKFVSLHCIPSVYRISN